MPPRKPSGRKPYTTGLKALGSQSSTPLTPDRGILETFPNPAPGSDYRVEFECSEFSSMCPLTGQPDFGSFSIEYAPAQLCLESKSLKLYLSSFRSEGAFWEDLSNRIADDLFEVLKPHWLILSGRMNVRGGIAIRTVVQRYSEAGEEEEEEEEEERY
jgi:7-cyano-7-deazaguanine reductase